MLARPACQPSALAQPNDQNPRGPRELFQKWVLSIEHPVKGWLDGHWLRRGDDREGYADEYVQGLWVAFKAFVVQPVGHQGEPDFKSDDNAVYIFSKLMAHKMAKSAANGRSGWQHCSQDDLSQMLRDHVEKGDPVDVANFCMMLCANGFSISKSQDQPATAKVDERAAFESWHNTRYPLHSMLLSFCERTGGYSYISRRVMFELWLARAKLNGGQA
ncbi:hypothetical protein V476_25555 [Pseudomonas syringae KCTC 12500]|nr:hypothetical protein V476_25555 [Pseudomonas syringae KCTC 12500]KPY67262.1 Uncharacterized protein ALO45_02431 [Pseudomonas syringae pv. syringae]POR87611.1 hypothetical protein BKM21_02975 [Pseudomonas syringae pv. syringae]